MELEAFPYDMAPPFQPLRSSFQPLRTVCFTVDGLCLSLCFWSYSKFFLIPEEYVDGGSCPNLYRDIISFAFLVSNGCAIGPLSFQGWRGCRLGVGSP